MILEFARKTFLTEIEFGGKISILTKNIFILVRSPPLVKFQEG